MDLETGRNGYNLEAREIAQDRDKLLEKDIATLPSPKEKQDLHPNISRIVIGTHTFRRWRAECLIHVEGVVGVVKSGLLTGKLELLFHWGLQTY